MFGIIIKDLNSFLNSIIGFVVLIFNVILSGIFLWVLPGNFNIIESGISSMYNYFLFVPWIFIFLIPSISMSSLSEEYSNETFEILSTKPISSSHLILAKYFSCLIISILLIIPSIFYIISLYFLTDPLGNIDIIPIFGSYLGLLLLTSSYVSIGIFSSSITKYQIISFLIALFICFFLYIGIELLSTTFYSSNIHKFGIKYHYDSISRGVIDSRDLMYFFCVNYLFISFSIISIDYKK